MKFYTYKRNHKKQCFPSKFFIFLKVVEFGENDLKMFISTLWYDNVDNYDFLKLIFFFSIEDLFGLSVF
jgi:hypothetical protein